VSKPLCTPLFSFGPIVKLADGDIGDNHNLILKVGPINVGSGVLLTKQEGENIGVHQDFVHHVGRLGLAEPVDFGKHLVHILIVWDDTGEDADVLNGTHALFARQFANRLSFEEVTVPE
jgi:hypothetical protein